MSGSAYTEPERTAFHLRKAGLDLGRIDDEELKQVPVLPQGTRLQQAPRMSTSTSIRLANSLHAATLR